MFHRSLTTVLIVLMFAVGVPVASTALVGVSPQESPTDGTCDDTGLVVCAGANAGGNAQCVRADPADPSTYDCSWTRGYIWQAFSPLGLSGTAIVDVYHEVEVCVGFSGAETCEIVDTGTDAWTCDWQVAMECLDDDGFSGQLDAIVLEIGECVTVTSYQFIQVHASSPKDVTTLGSVNFDNEGTGGDAQCNMNDGRDD